jgi:hypothetical protein
MAANVHIGSDVASYKQTFRFDRAIVGLNIYVPEGETLEISFNKGGDFLPVPEGLTSMSVGPCTTIMVNSSGSFKMVGVQG